MEDEICAICLLRVFYQNPRLGKRVLDGEEYCISQELDHKM